MRQPRTRNDTANAAKKTTLDEIRSADAHLVAAPWKGLPCFVKVRKLSDIELLSLGNFSLIETDAYRWSKAPGTKTRWSQMLEYANEQVKICKAALVSPTYDQIFELVGKHAFNVEVKAQIENANRMLLEMKPGPAKQELEEKRDSLILAWELVLPTDFMAAIVEDVLEVKDTDIKKLTESMLFDAAVLAVRGHKAPHEYIHGHFSAFNIRDIDMTAWIIYEERVADMRRAKSRKGMHDAG